MYYQHRGEQSTCSPEHEEEEEDHWGEQANMLPDLKEQGEHREQGTP
jgi:hypothetical protein